jgi:hypothetical protein
MSSTTVNKDFKVKNGIQVNGSGNFNGTVSVATPTDPSHATTKDYVDSAVASPSSSIIVQDNIPNSPTNGMFWLDSEEVALKVYLNGLWLNIAMQSDIVNLPNTDGGNAMTTIWTSVFNGGLATTY